MPVLRRPSCPHGRPATWRAFAQGAAAKSRPLIPFLGIPSPSGAAPAAVDRAQAVVQARAVHHGPGRLLLYAAAACVVGILFVLADEYLEGASSPRRTTGPT